MMGHPSSHARRWAKAKFIFARRCQIATGRAWAKARFLTPFKFTVVWRSILSNAGGSPRRERCVAGRNLAHASLWNADIPAGGGDSGLARPADSTRSSHTEQSQARAGTRTRGGEWMSHWSFAVSSLLLLLLGIVIWITAGWICWTIWQFRLRKMWCPRQDLNLYDVTH